MNSTFFLNTFDNIFKNSFKCNKFGYYANFKSAQDQCKVTNFFCSQFFHCVFSLAKIFVASGFLWKYFVLVVFVLYFSCKFVIKSPFSSFFQFALMLFFIAFFSLVVVIAVHLEIRQILDYLN